MAFGMDTEVCSQQELRDEAFLTRVQKVVGRELTQDEEEIAFAVRDQGGYNAYEAAVEVLANATA